mmetsp:Transcript_11985/g.17915  ORF Transcript_11985/g.17915 Transcript_11985/m.17915 type:complete len:181 (-) Transcript_11985:33-575(-)
MTSAKVEKDSDDEIPELEDVSGKKQVESKESEESIKQNRAEKKSRKALQKLNMKPIPNVIRVTVKKSRNIFFVISKPDVYKSSTSDTYVVFGEAKIEDLNAQAQANAAKQFNTSIPQPVTQKATFEDVADDEVVDEKGVEAKDIDLVMSQASCSRSKAVKALKANDNDIVNAIMQLTAEA